MMRPFIMMLIVWTPLFAGAEWGARAWIREHGDALDRTRNILRADPTIGWRQRPGLDTTFLDMPLTTNELGWRERAHVLAGKKPAILVLGPSSTFGWGVSQDETYASQLERMFEGNTARVINAGHIGYSMVQGSILFSEILETDIVLDTVVIAYGVNDVDRYRFFYESTRSDAEEFAQPHSVLSARLTNVLFSSALLNLGFKVLSNLAPTNATPDDTSLEDVRVAEYDFRKYLEEVIMRAQAEKAHVILLTTAVNLEQAGDSESQRIIRETRRYNVVLTEVGRQYGVSVVDIEGLIPKNEYDDYFVDPIHFSTLGNRLVAEALASIISSSHSPIYGNKQHQ